MRFVTIIIFAVAGRLVALATAKPIPNWNAGGIAIPLTRDASFLNSNNSIDIRDVISSHGISVEENILRGLDNYEMNTGTMHPFALKRIESGLGIRGATLPLTSYRNDMWMGEISIGTPPQTFKVQFSTSSADLWVLQTGCSGISGENDFWDPDSSISARKQSQPFELLYKDGVYVKGDRYTDNVTVAGFSADAQTFGSATSFIGISAHLQDKFRFTDGMLGLAFPSISELRTYPLFQSIIRQGRLINPTFSLKLSSSGAEMYIGGANSMLYHGDITYTRVTNPGFWQVSIDDIRINGVTTLENVPAIFDTGANYIFGDWERAAELYRPTGATLQEHNGFGYYYLPCDSFPTLGFTFGGRTFEIPSKIFNLGPIAEGSPNCFGTVLAQRSLVAYWNIGLPFLQSVYSVYDYNILRVGFAELS